ncbi:MAG: hypothetical protein ACPKMZ_01955 [Pleomorphochaeta sp.]
MGKNKINWTAVSAVVTTIGIISSLSFSLYFGLIQPKMEIKKNIDIICTNIEKEMEQNIKILDICHDGFYSNFCSNENEIIDGSDLLMYMYANSYLSLSSDFWDNNKQYLAIHSPENYSKYSSNYYYFKEFSNIYSDYNLFNNLSLSEDSRDEDLNRINYITKMTKLRLEQLSEFYNELIKE